MANYHHFLDITLSVYIFILIAFSTTKVASFAQNPQNNGRPVTFLGQPLGKINAFDQKTLIINRVIVSKNLHNTATSYYRGMLSVTKCFECKTSDGRDNTLYTAVDSLKRNFKTLDRAMLNLRGSNADGRQFLMTRYHEFAYKTHYCFVLSYGSDENIEQYAKRLPEWRKAEVLPSIFFQLVRAVAYMHRALLVHNDIKIENVLIDSSNPATPKVVLIDYKFARFLSYTAPNLVTLVSYCIGTSKHFQSECLKGKKYNPMKKDVWAIGATFYGLLFSKNLLTPSNLVRFYMSPRLFLKYLSITKTFKMDPATRKTMQNLIAEVAKLMAYKEKNRPTPQEYLNQNWQNPMFRYVN
ncbi:kinase-like domain-containing protein [Syncephalis fuscata]|nr:kinase-like domain-containing protein [Syncephalis fuscata]